MSIWEANGVRVYEVANEGAKLGSDRSASDMIGETYGQEIDLIAIPVARLVPEFLELKTRVAGDFLQKFVTYGFRIAIVGDISEAVAASKSLHDFVYESNKVGRVLFVRDAEELRQRL